MSNRNQISSGMMKRKKQKVKRLRSAVLAVFLLVAAFVLVEAGVIVYDIGAGSNKGSFGVGTESIAVAKAALEESPLEETVADEETEEAVLAETLEGTSGESVSVESQKDTENDEDTSSNEMLTVYDNIHLTGAEVFGDNILIDGIDVSGLTYEEAKTLVNDNLNTKILSEVKLKISNDERSYVFGDLGVSFTEQTVNDILKESIVYGNHGTLLTVYKEKETLKNEGKNFGIEFTIDEDKINQVITELSASYTEQLPKDAEIHRVNGEFVVTKEVRGIGINVDETVKVVTEGIKNWKSGNIEIVADVSEMLPEITADDLSVINDLLGSCRTSFADNLNYGRGINLKNGTSKIDDVVLMPGETLSVYERLTPFTKENGYQSATAYANGEYVDSIGGGICQISTTLYNAALEAEIDVVKRSNHSMTVGYVDYAFDAAVNDNGSKDLVIRNNYDYPIYIESYLYNMQVCVYIYGVETRDPNRVVEYYSEVVQEIFPTEEEYQYIEVGPGHEQYSPENGHLEDELVGPDEILQIQGNYPTCKAKLYKRVTVNGVVVEDTCLHTDKYRSSPAKFLVGANYVYPGKVVESTEASTETGTDTTNQSSTEGQTVPSSEAVTQTPVVTPSTESSGE